MTNVNDLYSTEIPWGELDTGIVEPVRVLYEAGFKSFASCSGHGTSWPWISLVGKDPRPVAQALKNAGYNQFNINIVHSYPYEAIDKKNNIFGDICHLDDPVIYLKVRWSHPNSLHGKGRSYTYLRSLDARVNEKNYGLTGEPRLVDPTVLTPDHEGKSNGRL